MAAGFTTGQPFHAAMYVFAVASMAYLECTGGVWVFGPFVLRGLF